MDVTLSLLLSLSCVPWQSGQMLGSGSRPRDVQHTPTWFVDVAAQAGVDALGFGRGAAMVDLDGDGRLDLIAADEGLPDRVYRQLPDHSFEDVASAWGFPGDDLLSAVVLATDFDNDGDPDVFIGSGGFSGASVNRFMRNDLNVSGRFEDVSPMTGVALLDSAVFGGTALDYDRDGDVDIFLADSRPDAPNSSTHLFRNDGGLVFTEVTAEAGAAAEGWLRHCSAGDFDNDGWPDIAVGHYEGPNLLFHNLGDGTFEDVASAAGLPFPVASFGLVLEDFDNDGWLDLYLPKFQPFPVAPSALLLNAGDGTFVDLTWTSGMTGQRDMGHNSGDLDGDGYPDIFIGTGSPNEPFPDLLFRVKPDPVRGLRAQDRSVESGIVAPGLSRSHGSAFGDYDEDGDVDVYVNTGGRPSLPETAERNWLLAARGSDHGWVALELTGLLSNRSAVGARAVATTTSGRRIHRHLTVGKGFGNTDSPILHFGLGSERTLGRIDILWPSGIEQALLAPAAFERHEVLESGMLWSSDPAGGGRPRIEVCGPAGSAIDLFLGTPVAGAAPPPFASPRELHRSAAYPHALVLDRSGRASFDPSTLPARDADGNPLWVQARIDSLVTNALPLAPR